MAQQWNPTEWFPTDWYDDDWFIASGLTDVTGTIAATLDDFTNGVKTAWYPANWYPGNWYPLNWPAGGSDAWFGTFYIPAGINATIQTTLQNFPTSFVGSVVQVDNFDVAVNFGITWVETEYFAFAGTLTPTLDDITSSLVGTAGSVAGVVGNMPMTLADATSAFSGTFVAPANETGTITTTLDDFASSLVGGSFSAGSALGNLTATLENFSGAFVGATVAPTYSITWSSTLDDFTADNWVGATYANGVSLFKLSATLDDFDCQIIGEEAHEFRVVESHQAVRNIRSMRVGGSGKVRVGRSKRQKG